MNTKRILLGGLAAGVFINISEAILNEGILDGEFEAMMSAHNLVEPSWAISAYVVGAFIFGFVVAWLYAVARARYGAGWKTATRVGVAVFLVGGLVPGFWFGSMGLLPSPALLMVWSLVELVAAAMIAGWLYRESREPTVAPGGA